MQIVKPSVEVEDFNPSEILAKIERAGRTCYKSEDKITGDSSARFVSNILSRGHESVIEHVNITAKVICDRGVTHEIVRHRIASYSQESTRYCDYGGEGINVVLPPWCEDICPGEYSTKNDFVDAHKAIDYSFAEELWINSMFSANEDYRKLRDQGWTPQQARSVLPNSLKTEIVMTMNLREWRHFFKLRCSKKAHPQMREVAIMLFDIMKEKLPEVFADLEE